MVILPQADWPELLYEVDLRRKSFSKTIGFHKLTFEELTEGDLKHFPKYLCEFVNTVAWNPGRLIFEINSYEQVD